MIEKEINWDGYTLAMVRCIEKDGSFLCDLCNKDTGKCDINISFPHYTDIFDLTEEEFNSLEVDQDFLLKSE